VNANISSPASTTKTTQKRKYLLSQCFDSKISIISPSSNSYQEIDDYLASDFSQSISEDENSDDTRADKNLEKRV
jgi:hypothetical protein